VKGASGKGKKKRKADSEEESEDQGSSGAGASPSQPSGSFERIKADMDTMKELLTGLPRPPSDGTSPGHYRMPLIPWSRPT
ncbi:hypothetical protein HAX54_005023, partial [Datura stramonium]|nr:hypothetical protein [Datura stramonium]